MTVAHRLAAVREQPAEQREPARRDRRHHERGDEREVDDIIKEIDKEGTGFIEIL